MVSLEFEEHSFGQLEDIQFPRLLRPQWRNIPNSLLNAIKGSTDMCLKFGLDPMSNFGIF